MIWRPDFTIQQREDTAKRELKEKVMGVIDESYNIPRTLDEISAASEVERKNARSRQEDRKRNKEHRTKLTGNGNTGKKYFWRLLH